MMGRIAKYTVMVFGAAAMSVAVLAQGPGQGMPGHHGGPMGSGNFSFVRIMGGFGGKVVTNAPFSAQVTRETVQILSNGTRVDQKETGNVARDSVGRTRQELTLPAIGPLAASGQVPHITFIRDPAVGKNYVLNENEKTVFTLNRPAGANARGRGAMNSRMGSEQNADVQTVSLGTKTMGGLTVQGTRTTRTIPTGQIGNNAPIVIIREEWYSQDLQMVVSSTRTDPRFGTTTYELTNINRSEPAQSLFAVPPDYTAAPARGMFKAKQAAPPSGD